MTEGKYTASINDAIVFLKNQKLFKAKGPRFGEGKTEEYKKACQRHRHYEIYQACLENYDYELLLIDDSVFVFSKRESVLGYSFLQNPRERPSEVEFLYQVWGEEEIINCTPEEMEERIALIEDHEFEQYLSEQDINSNALFIRYDFDNAGYFPLVHSYSHIHIGNNGNVRIPCSHVLTPLAFTAFCIKFAYYEKWKNTNATLTISQQSELIQFLMGGVEKLSNKDWHQLEKDDLHLTK